MVRVDGLVGRADDLTGWGFRLITTDSGLLTGLDSSHRGELDRIGVKPLVVSSEPASSYPQDIEGHYRQFFERFNTKVVLVRPDFVVFGSASTADEVVALVEDLTNQLPRVANETAS